MRVVVRPAWLLLSLTACSLLVDADPKKLPHAADLTPNDQDIDEVEGKPDAGAQDDAGDAAEPAKPDAGPPCTCDDGIRCTVDFCENGACQYVAEDELCDPGERCLATRGCVPRRCRSHADCDDNDVCTGVERCDPNAPSADPATGCVPGEPLDCDDHISCTEDACDPVKGCTHTVDDGACNDGIDCTIDRCDPEHGCQNEVSHERCQACFIGSYCSSTAGCQNTAFPILCADLDPCTVDRCDVELGMCIHVPDANNTNCKSAPDVCDRAEVLTLDAMGKASVTGRFSTLASDYETGCGQRGGRDAVYHVVLGDQVVDIFLDTNGSAARTVLGVSPGTCDAQGFGFGCAGAVSEAVRESRLVLHRYDPAKQGRDLFILVDAADPNEGGNYVLNVRVAPAASDSCSAQPLELDGCGATLIGFMDSRRPENAWGVERGTCQTGPGRGAPEAVFALKAASDGKVEVVASSDAFAPALYARTMCGDRDNTSELGCENSAVGNNRSARVTFSLAASARAHVFVDGGRDGAKYTLRCTQ